MESVNQLDTLCKCHYLNKATLTIISASNIFINNNRGCYCRKWLIGKTRTEQVLFLGSEKFDSGGCYYDLIPTPKKKSYWGMSNAYYPMKLIDFCMKYNKCYCWSLFMYFVSLIVRFYLCVMCYFWFLFMRYVFCWFVFMCYMLCWFLFMLYVLC